jgi:hypothetical protein
MLFQKRRASKKNYRKTAAKRGKRRKHSARKII